MIQWAIVKIAGLDLLIQSLSALLLEAHFACRVPKAGMNY